MSIFKRITNWATDKGNSYTKENEVYNEIISNVRNLESSLDFIINDNMLYEILPDEAKVSKFLNSQTIIDFKKKSIGRALTDRDRQIIILEIRRLELERERLLKEIKNLLLQSNQINDICESTRKINNLIYHNIILEALKGYAGINGSKKWKVEELENLKNKISLRKTEIIPYLGEIEQMKRK